ncbi:hypothetical protein FZC78_18320 [Rossellomorea vietnamensis]|uniref:Uncharacterized protein n=1 Tax=Rossellomorea vietnamensis TaxID=218284 RepID=A0A5D4NLR6_9BACI|nr:hypothetical protein FZC78_18320 [Rossellomorea vietnamensis]
MANKNQVIFKYIKVLQKQSVYFAGGLYLWGEGDEPVLGMAAEEPAVSEEGKTYTFKNQFLHK